MADIYRRGQQIVGQKERRRGPQVRKLEAPPSFQSFIFPTFVKKNNVSGPSVSLPVTLTQESISDFYWYYSGKDVIDDQGQKNFSKAINVAKQVFNTLTEYIQV